jgi:hypothetical protein
VRQFNAAHNRQAANQSQQNLERNACAMPKSIVLTANLGPFPKNCMGTAVARCRRSSGDERQRIGDETTGDERLRLVLMRIDSGGASCPHTAMQELADFISQIRQRKIRQRRPANGRSANELIVGPWELLFRG